MWITAKHLWTRSSTEGANRTSLPGTCTVLLARPAVQGRGLHGHGRSGQGRGRKGKERLAETRLATHVGCGGAQDEAAAKLVDRSCGLPRSLLGPQPLASGGLKTHWLSSFSPAAQVHGMDTDWPKTNREGSQWDSTHTIFGQRVGPGTIGKTPKRKWRQRTHRTCKKENEDDTLEDSL